MNVSTGMLKHLRSASVLSCGFGSSPAGEKDTPACGLQLVTEAPAMTKSKSAKKVKAFAKCLF